MPYELPSPTLTELKDMLSVHFADHPTDLPDLVRTSLGARLFAETFPIAAATLRLQVSGLLDGLDRQGITVVFVRAVLRAYGELPDLMTFCQQRLPLALDAPTSKQQIAAAVTGIQAVRRKLVQPPIYDLIRQSGNELADLGNTIDRMKLYKDLHDVLHILQTQYYRPIRDAVRGFAADPAVGRDLLFSYADGLRTQAILAESAAGRLPADATGRDLELAWILDLKKVVADLHTAFEQPQELAARSALAGLTRILRYDPTRINQVLTSLAEALPLDRLLGALTRITAIIGVGDADQGDLQRGLVALRSLHPRLLGHVEEHTWWQRIEKDLWFAEDNLYRDTSETLEEFELLWPALEEQVRSLCRLASEASWSLALDRHRQDFRQAFGAQQKRKARDAFDRYRREAMFHFFEVDKSLKELCADLAELGGPVRELLEGADHANR